MNEQLIKKLLKIYAKGFKKYCILSDAFESFGGEITLGNQDTSYALYDLILKDGYKIDYGGGYPSDNIYDDFNEFLKTIEYDQADSDQVADELDQIIKNYIKEMEKETTWLKT